MKIVSKISMLFIVISIVLSSISQYHHHNKYGEICLYTSQICDEALSYCDHDEEHTHYHCDGCNTDHSDEEHTCSFRLSNVQSTKRVTIDEPTVCDIIESTISIFIPIIVDKKVIHQYKPHIFPVLKLLFSKFKGFRAPPCF